MAASAKHDVVPRESPVEDRLRRVIDTIPALVLSARPDGAVDFINQRWLDYTGFKAEDLRGWGWRNVIHPEDVERFGEEWRAALAAGEPFENEARIRRADGEFRWFLIRKVPLRDQEGNIVQWYGSGHDIEDYKQAEKKLRRSEAELQQVLDVIPAHVFVFGPDGRGYFANRQDLEYTGLTLQGFRLQDAYSRILHSEDVERTNSLRQRVLSEGLPFEMEARIRAKTGEYRWFLIRVNPLKDEHGHVVRWYGTRTDIEDLKRTEGELRRDEFYLAEGERLAHMGSWAFNPSGFFYHWSRELFRIYGLDPDGEAPTLDQYLAIIHPDDREFMAHTIEQMVAEHIGCDIKKRILRPNGEVRYIRCVGVPVVEQGVLKEIVGTAIDVTEQEHLTQELQRRQVYLQQVLDLTPQFVAVFGPSRERLYANRTALDYLGVSLEEWRETSDLFRFFHQDDGERVIGEKDNAFETGAPHQFEARLRRSDGSYRWFWLRYNPLRDEQGQVTRWYVACTDIDDRKRAEERLRNENVVLREEIDRSSMFEEIIGSSAALRGVLVHVAKVAPTDSTVLITGETGTGKELVARAIHKRSQRAARSFVSVNCAAIPPSLIASELFGHEKGAFTGASQRRLGRFELADGGTIFLDEIGELPPETQIALLRVLQERAFERIGGSQSIVANARVLAATNRDLQAAVEAGTFRRDLFYRLNVFPIHVPPLRDRTDDIRLLVAYLTQRYANKAGKKIRSVKRQTLELLETYDWPGNIRELQNVLERAVILCDGDTLAVDEKWLRRESLKPDVAPRTLARLDVNQEKETIESALTKTRGRVSGPDGAAAKLGIPRSTLESKIRTLGINKYQFKSG